MKRFFAFSLIILIIGYIFCPSALAETVVPENTPDATVAPDADPDDIDPASLVPTGRLAGIIIGVDAGHQAHANTGKEPVSPGSKEKKTKVAAGTSGVKTHVAEYIVNLDVSLKLRDVLEAEGATVIMARETNDVDISNVERAKMMNENGAQLFLRIHCNGANTKTANGIGLYVRKSGGSIVKEAYTAAKCILPRMIEATGAHECGIFKRDTYSGLNWAEMPSILVEMGYMSNPEEDVKLNDPEYQDKLVQGMVEGVCDYFAQLAESQDPSDGE